MMENNERVNYILTAIITMMKLKEICTVEEFKELLKLVEKVNGGENP